MSSEIQTSNRTKKQIELPQRQLCEDLASVQALADRAGQALGVQAKIVSAFEWSLDRTVAERMRETLRLSQDEYAELLEKFRQRNKSVWGTHSRTVR